MEPEETRDGRASDATGDGADAAPAGASRPKGIVRRIRDTVDPSRFAVRKEDLAPLHRVIEEQSDKSWQRATFFISLAFAGAVLLIGQHVSGLPLILGSILVVALCAAGVLQYFRQDAVLEILREIVKRGCGQRYWYHEFLRTMRVLREEHPLWKCRLTEPRIVCVSLLALLGLVLLILVIADLAGAPPAGGAP
ncbi:MAG: hypothetical protein JXP34_05840 [Planctomycetes bacterium]|nr:hypothetical protein [Planctomycetota bacterium]